MITFDVKDLARGLIVLGQEHTVLKEKVAVELLGYALEIFNHPHRRMAIIDDLIDHYEYELGIFGLDTKVVEWSSMMRLAAQRYGWDKRLKAKIEFKELGKGFHHARFVMDLDESVAWILAQNTPQDDGEESVIDVVSDNPEADVINALAKLHPRKTRKRVPLLSDRNPAAVRQPEETGWRVGHWERFGENALRRAGPRVGGEDD